MEKAILKTLIYADIFDYPLKAWEIHKWLIGRKATLKQIEKALKKKSIASRVNDQRGCYFLRGKKQLIRKRINREGESLKYLKTAKFAALILKLIPWIKLVGISGSLSMRNSGRKDDIDLFIVTSENRLFISRIFTIFLTSILGKRRKSADRKNKVGGKICVNLLLSEESLAQNDSNIYLAHEVLQMVPLWQRDGVYHKYLDANSWVFKFLPNWITTEKAMVKDERLRNKVGENHQSFIDYFERLAKWFQLMIMKTPKGDEKISNHALYFHPENHGIRILKAYNKKIKKLK